LLAALRLRADRVPPGADNSAGPIDDAALQRLGPVAQLARHLGPGGTAGVISDWHFAVQLNQFIPGLLSY
jgi:hypothetical protein